MGSTTIEWCTDVWNPVRGCARVSAGCENCYAERFAHRFSGPGGTYEGLTASGPKGPRWTGKVTLVPEVLDQPLRWRNPKRIFVNSMSDLFHESVPDAFIVQVFAAMSIASTRGHVFQILTKRPERMRDVMERISDDRTWDKEMDRGAGRFNGYWLSAQGRDDWQGWPLPNVWLGVSCEDQATADERIPTLLDTPAAVRFVSAEPLLSMIDFECFGSTGCPTGWIDGSEPGLDWIIVGGESGPKARPCDINAVRSIVKQCADARVACFVKQIGARPYIDVIDNESEDDVSQWFGGARVHWDDNWESWLPRLRSRSGSNPAEWPDDLRVRQFPEDRQG